LKSTIHAIVKKLGTTRVSFFLQEDLQGFAQESHELSFASFIGSFSLKKKDLLIVNI